MLSPTDPVVTSTVVTARRVPALDPPHAEPGIRLNDGLALPLVLFFLTLAAARRRRRRAPRSSCWARSPSARSSGVVLAFVGGRALRRLPGGGIARNYEGVYALGLALAAYGLADATFGNGLIAAFVAGVALGVAEHDIPEAFGHFNENMSAIFQVSVFFLFGALIVSTSWGESIAAAGAVHRVRAAPGPARRGAGVPVGTGFRPATSSSSPGSARRAWPRCCSRCSS